MAVAMTLTTVAALQEDFEGRLKGKRKPEGGIRDPISTTVLPASMEAEALGGGMTFVAGGLEDRTG
jgi:hypothetical protein